MPLPAFLFTMTWVDWLISLVDIALVAYLFYRFFLLIRGTRAVPILSGILVLVVFTSVSGWLRLDTIHWLLRQAQLALIVVLPIVFQPELRRALEQLGRGRFFARPLFALPQQDVARMIEEVVRAVEQLSRNKVGAIIVIERETGLNEIIETGIIIDGIVSAPFLVNVFIPNTPLHDGAVIIRGNRVMAAGAFLPLTEEAGPGPELGSRHRAALGISEHSDAVAVVVSEETGRVSLAHGGKLIRNLDDATLKELLTSLLAADEAPALLPWMRGSS